MFHVEDEMVRVGVHINLLDSLPTLAGELADARCDWIPIDEGAPGPHSVSVVIIGGNPFDADLMDRFPQLRLIVRAGIGLDLIDLDHARRRNIRVANTPGYATDEVADHTLLLLLAAVRRLTHFAAEAGRDWSRIECAGVPRLRGATLGVVGLGRIGRAVADRAMAFGLRILYRDPLVSTAAEGMIRVELPQLLAESDLITLHAPLTAETRHLLNRATFASMRRRPVIVNTARGGLINTADLIIALDEGRIASAALDVADGEPEPPRTLLDHPAVIITPHVAWFSEGARREMARLAVAAVATNDRAGQLVSDPKGRRS